jgi:hypothetical protein
MGRYGMRVCILLFFGVMLVLPASAHAQKQKGMDKKDKAKIAGGKETTYFTAPLNKDGTVDYLRALNERLRSGVTGDNNACVLLWQALGTKPAGAAVAPEFLAALGIKATQDGGSTFVDLARFIRDNLKTSGKGQRDTLWDEENLAVQRPWTAKDFPSLAAWLKVNEKPLRLVVEASKRSRFWYPLVTEKNAKVPLAWLAARNGTGVFTPLARALTARAMLRAADGDHGGAWDDLLACHRIARLVVTSPSIADSAVGIAIDQLAVTADVAFWVHAKPPVQRLEEYDRDLAQLPPLAGVGKSEVLFERCMMLDCLTAMARFGPPAVVKSVWPVKENQPNLEFDRLPKDVEWEQGLRNLNVIFERLETLLGEANPQVRRLRALQFEKELDELKSEIVNLNKYLSKLEGDGHDITAAWGIWAGDALLCTLMPSVAKAQEARDRLTQWHANLRAVLALERYHRSEGRYPRALNALVPRFSDQVPTDAFSRQPLIYRPRGTGFLLYSIGVNGQDDEGRGADDNPPGDDLSIRVPLPPARR